MSASKVVAVALGEVGYLEKKSNAYLDNKTANAGSGNYTKYGAWFDDGKYQAQPWCNMFVSWVGHEAGEEEAVGHYAYVPSHINFFERQGRYFPKESYTPVPGDVIFFRNESHVGIVEYVQGSYVHTIEGNTSSGTTLVANGGGVHRKSYHKNSSYILGYGHPAYKEGGQTEPTQKEEFEVAKTYRNGSTPEIVYADTAKKKKIGSLNPWESCDCLGMADDMYIVRYKVDGTSTYKVGVVEYHGGVK